MSKIKDQNCKI